MVTLLQGLKPFLIRLLLSRLKPRPTMISPRYPSRPTKNSPRLIAAMMESGPNQVAVHFSDELDGNFLGANGFALTVICATAEQFIRHGRDHAQRATIALRLSLRE